jgi:NifB/MoaA-like Fe-S oxidoreductase
MEYQPNLKNITGDGGVVINVEPGSTAEALGLQIGDVVQAVNGQLMRDVIDYRFAMAEERVEVLIQRGDEQLCISIDKDSDDGLGLEFSEPLWDRLRTCNNKCPFCFLTQMPKGFRKTLYLKDDDYRLSFLYGNFVTLTNLREEDWHRIGEQRLTPLYISVHATDPYMRGVMLGKPDAGDILTDIRRLGSMGVDVHTQFVVCPGLNDGEVLRQSVEALTALHPVVQSIAAVPVGLTKFRFNGKAPQSVKAAIQVHETPDWIDANWERQPLWAEQMGGHAAGRMLPALAKPDLGFCARSGDTIFADIPLRTFQPSEAAQVIDLLEPYQVCFREELGYGLVYPSDEFYLLAGREVPPAAVYTGSDQVENGVGMVRKFQDEWAYARYKLPPRTRSPKRVIIVTGMLAEPVLRPIVDRIGRIPGMWAELKVVRNDFFGDMVTVAGLLTAGDIIAQVAPLGPADLVILPRVMFDYKGERTIDEHAPQQIAAELGSPVAMARAPMELVRILRTLAKGLPVGVAPAVAAVAA